MQIISHSVGGDYPEREAAAIRLLQDANNGAAEIVDILAVDAGDINSTVTRHINTVFVSQAFNLLGADIQKRKHTALLGDEIEVVCYAFALELFQ